MSGISQIEINSWTSPEPGVAYNRALSKRRSEAIKNYILERWDVPDSLLIATGNGIAWDKLRDVVAASSIRYRDEILNIIDNVPEETWRRTTPNARWLTLVDSRQKHLMDLRGGRAYNLIYDSIFPQLRYGSQVSLTYNAIEPLAQWSNIELRKSIPQLSEERTVASGDYLDSGDVLRKPIIAIKTNLLFDAATALNVEVEVPIMDRWSVAAEWIFPWWVTENNGNALEVLSGTIEGRYWFGEREDRAKMTGWFAGLYASGGLYDLQWKNNGYQGEFFIAGGLSGGYAHSLNSSNTLRMEYSLGFGYLKTDYRYYEGRLDNKYLVWQHDGSYTWFGPTKAKVSLVWMIHNRRGGKQ